MKKPFSILAIAIIISSGLVFPIHRLYADDVPAPAAPESAAPTSAPAPDPAPAPTPTPAPIASTDPTSSASTQTPPTTAPATASAAPETPPVTSETDSSANLPPPATSVPESSSGTVASSSPTVSSTPTSTSTPSVPPTTVSPTSSAGVASTTAATSTDPAGDTLDATISNAATTTSTTMVDASSGNNTVTGTSTDTAAIQTGDAVADSNVVNVVNVNLFDSDALIALLNGLSSGNSNLNLDSSAFWHDGSLDCAGCSAQISTATSSILSSSASLSATNTASIGDASVVRASTGGNTATGGNAAIVTGNAYAAGNVATLANATLVDSHYAMLVLNNFGSWGGDLVLPSLSFWSNFLNSAVATDTSSGIPDETAVSVGNTAAVSTDATTSADTGGNVASSTDGGSLVSTGSAQSAATVVNDVNQTHIGGGTVDIIFHIFGNWSGQAFNLPPGFRAVQTPGGLEIVASTASESAVNQGALALSAANNASVTNSLDVGASTGGNAASGSTAGIVTGNAYAAANSITAANVTSISHNWLAAIVNIFGDWNGNLSFGQPDLWVAIRADAHTPAPPGDPITYHYTVQNRGDAAVHNVHLTRDFGSGDIQADPDDSGSWDLGTLQPGESREIVEPAVSAIATWAGMNFVSDTVHVSGDEPDAHPEDNSDVISLYVGQSPSGGGSGPVSLPRFVITKTNDATSTIQASSTVGYTIHLVNQGGLATHAVVADQITDGNGSVIHNEDWDLGQVKPGEDITLTYSAFFSASSTPGIYVNSAQVFSADSQFATSSMATTSVTIGDPVTPVALVTSIAPEPSTPRLLPHFQSAGSATTTATSTLFTVKTPFQLMFVGRAAPLPPDAGGAIPSKSLLASVGDAAMGPYAWPLYLLVLSAGAWYLVSKRKSFGWGIAPQEK